MFRKEAGRGVGSRAEFERLKGRYLGREKGRIPGLFAGIRDLPSNERGAFGSRANAAKQEVEGAIARLAADLERREVEARRADHAVDGTLPGRRPRLGGLHPVTNVGRSVREKLLRMGYRNAPWPAPR